MATLKIPYGGTTYSLFMQGNKITTPSIIVAGQGYIPLYQGGNIGDPVLLWGQHVLKKAPMKVAGNGTWYRPTWYHAQIGSATCDVYYKASYPLHEGAQNVVVCTAWNQYGQCIAWGNQTQYRYYHKLYSNIKIADFTIANDDCRLVVSSMTCQEVDVNNTEGKHHEIDSAWGSWTTTRHSNYPAKPTKTLDVIATGEYSLQINCNNTWVTLKSGTCTCPVNVNISSTSTQVQTVSLTLG